MAKELGFKTHQVEAILTNTPNDICGASFKMLVKWQEKVTSESEAWEALMGALNKWLPGDQMQELYDALMAINETSSTLTSSAISISTRL